MTEKRIVVLTGAGISAESGVRTFRDNNGLWEEHAVEDVATPQAWQRDAGMVWRFYQARRRQLLEVEPNGAHVALADLQSRVDSVTLVTQNVDDLHERGGSSEVIHMHGELRTLRCEISFRLGNWSSSSAVTAVRSRNNTTASKSRRRSTKAEASGR